MAEDKSVKPLEENVDYDVIKQNEPVVDCNVIKQKKPEPNNVAIKPNKPETAGNGKGGRDKERTEKRNDPTNDIDWIHSAFEIVAVVLIFLALFTLLMPN